MRTPLFDGADPVPWTDKPLPLGGARFDAMPGLVASSANAWELGASLRWSAHVLGWPSGRVEFGNRGAVEVDVRRFVPPHDMRTDLGIWEGGYAGGSIMAELWGRRQPGSFSVGTAHIFVGYRGLLEDRNPTYLEVGWGVWGDRTQTATVDPMGGTGPLIRVGIGGVRTLAGTGR